MGKQKHNVQKPRNFLGKFPETKPKIDFQNVNLSTENSETKIKCSGNSLYKDIFENLGITRAVVLSAGNSGNAVPFVTGNFRKCEPEFAIEWKAPQKWIKTGNDFCLFGRIIFFISDDLPH